MVIYFCSRRYSALIRSIWSVPTSNSTIPAPWCRLYLLRCGAKCSSITVLTLVFADRSSFSGLVKNIASKPFYICRWGVNLIKLMGRDKWVPWFRLDNPKHTSYKNIRTQKEAYFKVVRIPHTEGLNSEIFNESNFITLIWSFIDSKTANYINKWFFTKLLTEVSYIYFSSTK